MLRGKNKFINGLDDIAITFEHIDAIKAYEQKSGFNIRKGSEDDGIS